MTKFAPIFRNLTQPTNEIASRLALSKSITLVESTRRDHYETSQLLLKHILNHKQTAPKKWNGKQSFRIGLSGSPGVGKSSFIETFGMYLLQQDHKLAVLAVDPSSSRTGGSILGDKTRMTCLSRHERAFIRPSPTCGNLGGVQRNTSDSILLCQAAGYDVIFVETVGVGQSETMVADMVDMFVLIMAPGSGDELQGMKKGIVELADMIIVNKSDGILEIPAKTAQNEYKSALNFIQPTSSSWKPPVLRVSSVESKGLVEVWDKMKEFQKILALNGELDIKRSQQQHKWMWNRVIDTLLTRLKNDSFIKSSLSEIEKLVTNGKITAGQAADELLQLFFRNQQ